MMTVDNVYINGESVRDLDKIREVIRTEDKYTIVAIDSSGQMHLLSSTDYKGEIFTLGNSTIII